MTQSPSSMTVSTGEKVTISCKSSQSLLYSFPGDIVLLQSPTSILVSLEQRVIIASRAKKTGQPSKFLISFASDLTSGSLAKFSGSGCETDITLTLHAVEGEDAATISVNRAMSYSPQCSRAKQNPLGAYADIVMTQSPTSLAVSAGEKVTISCKSSQSLLYSGNNYLA
ncbi:hypothetical protein U0070_007663, partial [Myodes glareolus]